MCYTYDDLNRVTSRTVKNLADDSVISTENFTYDGSGNLTSAPDSTFAYDINNKLTVFNGQGVRYDADGNMIFGDSMCCEYDSTNRLIAAGDHDYTYNAENVRIRNLCMGENTTYVYNTNCKLSQLLVKTTNGVITKYVYGLGLIGEETNSVFKTYHFDNRGSTIAITDADGNITDTFAYDTYGKCISRTGTSTVIFGYNGRDGVVTDRNGLIYMRARYYSPEMRRFINADIVAGEIANGITLNRYAYANGNPVAFVDPMGLSAWSWFKEKVVDPFVEHIVEPAMEFIGENIIEPTVEFVDKTIVEPITERIESRKNKIDYMPSYFKRGSEEGYTAEPMGYNNFFAVSPNFSLIKRVFLGHEKRISAGWQPSDLFIQNPLFRFGISHYITNVKGNGELLYTFSGKTTDMMNIVGTTGFAGIGVDLFGGLGAEIQLEILGIGAQLSIGELSIGANINALGATSITFARNRELESGVIQTDGLTIGVNTGVLLATVTALIRLFYTGDSTGIDFVGEMLRGAQ